LTTLLTALILLRATVYLLEELVGMTLLPQKCGVDGRFEKVAEITGGKLL
jgi:hypothetical protein